MELYKRTKIPSICQELNEAYEVLTNASKRTAYNVKLTQERSTDGLTPKERASQMSSPDPTFNALIRM